MEEQGKLDAANVLTYKRARQPTDYAALSRAVCVQHDAFNEKVPGWLICASLV